MQENVNGSKGFVRTVGCIREIRGRRIMPGPKSKSPWFGNREWGEQTHNESRY